MTFYAFMLLQYYPFWAVGVALLLIQVAVFYNRKENRLQRVFWISSFVVLLTIVAWIYFRGDLNSGRWVRAVAGQGQT